MICTPNSDKYSLNAAVYEREREREKKMERKRKALKISVECVDKHGQDGHEIYISESMRDPRISFTILV